MCFLIFTYLGNSCTGLFQTAHEALFSLGWCMVQPTDSYFFTTWVPPLPNRPT